MLLGQAILGSFARDDAVHARRPIVYEHDRGITTCYGRDESVNQIGEKITEFLARATYELHAAGHDALALNTSMGKELLFNLLEADPSNALSASQQKMQEAKYSQFKDSDNKASKLHSGGIVGQAISMTTQSHQPSNRVFESREQLDELAKRLAERRAQVASPVHELESSHPVIASKHRRA
jgi:hypothetical protein